MIEELYQKFQETKKVCTDTRNIIPDSIFFALKGPNFNANHFALDALKAGAAYAVIDEDINATDARLIKVDDTLLALQQLATHHLRQLHIPVIAITGSNGKTTTKELVRCVLSTTYRTLATTGNLNNHIGVPLTLLSIDDTIEVAVIEMGANHQKEIEQLCAIAEPGYGLITNVGKAHLEGFGGFEGVIKGKTEMYDYLKKNDGVIFCNRDNQWLQPLCSNYNKVFYYGTDANAEVTGKLIADDLFLKVEWSSKQQPHLQNIQTQLAGSYNFENILAAIAVGDYFKIEAGKINEAIAGYLPANQRSQILHRGNTTIMLDAYNANPTSMHEAIVNFDKNFAAPKMVLLGDMFELGADESAEHKRIIELLNQCNFDKIVLVGKRFAEHKAFTNALFFDNSTQARDWLKTQVLDGVSILIKGSRSSKMELVLE